MVRAWSFQDTSKLDVQLALASTAIAVERLRGRRAASAARFVRGVPTDCDRREESE